MTDHKKSFSDRDGLIWLDGQMVEWRDANVHVLTHAMHYASAVFEGQRAYDGNIFKLREHTMRLAASARMLGFDIPWSYEQINAACMKVLKANRLTDAYLRPIAWRGSEHMGVDAPASTIHLAVTAWEWRSYFSPENENNGIRLNIAPWRRPAPYTAPVHAKASGLYMICTLSKNLANERGFDDALMLDWRGQVAEATGANIFFVKDGVLHTPSPDCFLDGITRRTVIALAEQYGIKVVERAIWPEELSDFEDCFLTGSAAEVAFVRSIGPWSFEPGQISRALRDDYQTLVRMRPDADAAA